MENDTPLFLRLPHDLKERAKRLAKSRDRSMSTYIRDLIRADLRLADNAPANSEAQRLAGDL